MKKLINYGDLKFIVPNSGCETDFTIAEDLMVFLDNI